MSSRAVLGLGRRDGLRAAREVVEPYSFQGNAFNYVPAGDREAVDSMRLLALTMMTGAIVNRGAGLARPPARKSWLARRFR